MRPRLLNLLTALSLLLCVAVAVLWVRSYFVHDMLYVPIGGRTAIVQSASGQLFTIVVSQSVEARWLRQRPIPPDGASRIGALVHVRWDLSSRSPSSQYLILPHWLLAAFAALPPAVATLMRRRRGRKRSGLCPACGYDLRATPGRCPECGMMAADRTLR